MDVETRRPVYLRIWFWLLAILLLPCLVLTGLWFIAGQSVRQQLADLRSQGMPTSAAEVDDFYRVPDGEADTTELWTKAIDAATSLESHQAVRDGGLPILGTGPTPIPLPPESWDQLQVVRDFLKDVQPVVTAVYAAGSAGGTARLPADFSAGIATDLPYTQNARQITRLLQLDAFVSLHDGDSDQALRDVLHMFAASDMLQAEPCLISQLIRIATFSIACDTAIRFSNHQSSTPESWTDTQLASLQLAAANADFLNEMKRALCGERAITLTELNRFPLAPLRNANRGSALDLFELAIKGMDTNWTDALSAARQINAKIKSQAAGGIARFVNMGVLMIFPALESGMKAGASATARQHCLITGIAARRFHMTHGSFPETIDELAGFLPDANVDFLDDPYTGTRLIYKVNEANVLIYSIADNLVDDGGDIDQSNHKGRTPDIGMLISY